VRIPETFTAFEFKEGEENEPCSAYCRPTSIVFAEPMLQGTRPSGDNSQTDSL
jgi:hypothetical protein